jgi:hypothetical protein
MSISKRFFKNPYPDYKDVLSIDRSYWTNYLEELAIYCVKKTKLNDSTCDGGLYVGNLGLVYMIYKVLSNGYCKNYEKELKKYAHEAIELNGLYSRKNKDKTSFILGNCGYYAMASLISKFLDENDGLEYAKEYTQAAKLTTKKDFLANGSDELFVGRTGVLCGVLFYRKKLGIDVIGLFSACFLLFIIIIY